MQKFVISKAFDDVKKDKIENYLLLSLSVKTLILLLAANIRR